MLRCFKKNFDFLSLRTKQKSSDLEKKKLLAKTKQNLKKPQKQYKKTQTQKSPKPNKLKKF